MEASLARELHDNTRLFKQVVVNVATHGLALVVEVDVHVLALSRSHQQACETRQPTATEGGGRKKQRIKLKYYRLRVHTEEDMD